MTEEFGHTGIITPSCCTDTWGVGPFIIEAADKQYRFEDNDRFGPALIGRRADPLANPYPPERSPFWRAHRIWRRQGRRTEDGINCIWDEPKPSIVKHLHGRNFLSIEAGEEDGVTLVQTVDGKLAPISEYVRRHKSPPIIQNER